jgi:hypothetical protein
VYPSARASGADAVDHHTRAAAHHSGGPYPGRSHGSGPTDAATRVPCGCRRYPGLRAGRLRVWRLSEWQNVQISGSAGAGARVDLINPNGTEVAHWSGVEVPRSLSLNVSEPIHSKLYITGIFPNTSQHCGVTLES